MTIEAEGSCLCGAVTITAKLESNSVGACHCDMCRKWAAGPFMAIDCGTDIDIAGADQITTYVSSEWAERAFCGRCGSLLYYHLKAAGQFIVSAGIFSLDDTLHFDHQVFIEEKPPYYTFSNATKDMTGEELFAQVKSNADCHNPDHT